ncbi:MAG: hypothetical protein V4649_06245 [Bacteroidota bacterium]
MAFILSMIFFLLVYKPGHSQTRTTLSPTRIVFDASGNTLKDFTVTNSSRDTVRYLFSLIEMRMNEKGKLEAVPMCDQGQLCASKLLFIYPEMVDLAPGEARIVKVRYTAAAGMASGEYRSHIYVRQQKGAGRTAITNNDLADLKGITMPVMVRVGEVQAQAAIAPLALQFTNDTPALKLNITRSGNMSLYGDINVLFVDTLGRATNIGNVKGTAIYTPNTSREYVVKLKPVPGINYQAGKLKVEYAGAATAAVLCSADRPSAIGEGVCIAVNR